MITLLHIYLLKKLQLLKTLQQLDKQQIKKVIFKNCAPFSSCIRRINNTQIDHAQYIDAVMPIHNLIEYSVDYSKYVEFYIIIVEIYQLYMLMIYLLILLKLMLWICLIVKIR